MGRTRSFALAALAAISLLAGASASVHAHDLLDGMSPRPAIAAAGPLQAEASSETESVPNRAPFAIAGLVTLAAGMALLRRVPALVS